MQFFLKRKALVFCVVGIVLCSSAAWCFGRPTAAPTVTEIEQQVEQEQREFIKWLEFDVPEEALTRALNYDVKSHEEEIQIHWIEILAYLAAKNGGDFSDYKSADMDDLVSKLKSGTSMEELTKDMKYYAHYLEGYTAVLGGMVGDYEVEVEENGTKTMQRKYGLKAFSPIAAGYGYSHYDDFGNSRTYGFARKHLGNDLMGSVGTPIVAVESGTVEALGWNQYGGWRVGIRSSDSNRYYYYAHLRKDRPYIKDLHIGQQIKAGDVIGYLGMSGYSTKENVNNINQPHLHFGIQIIFDESQKDGNNEIWIDCYHLVNFLQKHRSAVQKNSDTGDFERIYDFRDPAMYE